VKCSTEGCNHVAMPQYTVCVLHGAKVVSPQPLDNEQIVKALCKMQTPLSAFLLGAACARARKHPERTFFDIWREVLEDANCCL
jgi:hypothetical protein